MATNDGGQAFPLGVSADNSGGLNHGRPGMTLRDYFAAHAPEVPDWFEVPRKPRPARPELPAHWPEDVQRYAHDWLLDSCYDFGHPAGVEQAEADEFVRVCNAYWAAIRQAEVADVADRYFSWFWHYADVMLAERAK